jgi:hypothetical protein
MIGVLAAMLIVGCQGSKVAKAPQGPQVDVSVEPIRVGNRTPPAEARRAQRIATATPANPVPDSSPIESRSASENTVEESKATEEERPRRRRRRTRRSESSEETERRREPKRESRPEPKKEKSFDDLSPEERRRIIEGG